MVKNPFKFLDSYTKADKDRFFGREKETAQLYNIVHASNLVLLYGASGTGKSSLINCGLANRFHDTDWYPIFIRRGSHLIQAMHREINKAFPTPIEGTDISIPQKIKQLYLEYYRPVYLIFDQFEEIFILGDKREQFEFYQTILTLMKSNLQCKVIIIVREEWIAFLNEFEKAIPTLFDNRMRIEKMNDRNIMRVIVGTIRYGKIRIKEPKRTIPQIIKNVRDKRERIDLTNLQVYLDWLFRKDLQHQERKGETITHVTFTPELVEQVGPMANVLAEFLNEQLKKVEENMSTAGLKSEGIPLEILFTLVTEDGTKRSMSIEDIAKMLPQSRNISEKEVKFCLDELIKAKVLRVLEET